ncbi:hypothetical protein V6N13_063222 [Hibiscus sabdariffa]|uniref:Avr9/Cf-9 rapidly elicited protein 146 n=2 Tax=Hibiscus sabdariffa TaxID=183260 RepID=A0ABR2C4K0_9ROSI
MEQNLPVISKRVWSIVRAVLFMVKKGILLSKPKFLAHLNMLLKRGKIASSKAIANLLMLHQLSSSAAAAAAKASVSASAAREYEFSCSNTPAYIFPFNLATKKKHSSIHNYYHQFFACTYTPTTRDEDNNDNDTAVVAASPMLPGFGQTPLVRQLRVTDSPFPLRDADEGNGTVDKAAEDFIQRFYMDLKLQNNGMPDF